MAHFSLVSGGPFYRMLVRARLIKADPRHAFKRAAWFALITWLPLLALSVMEGVAIGGAVHVPFFHDFAAQTRFLLAGPLLIIVEIMIDPRIRSVAMHFIDSGLVQKDDLPEFESAVAEVSRLRNLTWVEMMFLAAVVIVSLSGFKAESLSGGISTWHEITSESGPRVTLAGWWFAAVSMPLFQFLLLRWLWTLLIWSFFLWRMSRLDLRLVATHPDLAGGLGFLGGGQAKFGPLIFAASSVAAAALGQRIIFGGEPLVSFKTTIVAYVALILFIFLGPLLVFSSKLLTVKRQGLLDYGKLATGYTQSFDGKWVRGHAPEGEALLGSSDLQSLADLGNSYQVVRSMRVFPVSRDNIIAIVGPALIPMLPLALTVVPLEELLLKVAKLLF